jgi:hypothetical protein
MVKSRTYKCYCSSLKCNGSYVSATLLENHKRLDEAAQRRQERTHHTTMDTMVQQVFHMTLGGRTSSPESKCGDAFWERTGDKTTQRLFHTSAASVSDTRLEQPGSNSTASISKPINAESGPDCIPASIPKAKRTEQKVDDRIPKLYAKLIQIDHEIDRHTQNVNNFTEQPITNISDEPLCKEEQWFSDTIDDIQVVNHGGDAALIALMAKMVDKSVGQLSAISVEKERREEARVIQIHQSIVFNTGRFFVQIHTSQMLKELQINYSTTLCEVPTL